MDKPNVTTFDKARNFIDEETNVTAIDFKIKLRPNDSSLATDLQDTARENFDPDLIDVRRDGIVIRGN